MTLDIIAFIASILFGILLYWRESKGNGLYRFLNKLLNSKELQMKPEDRTGFLHQQKFLLRFVFIAFLFLIFILIFRFLIPIDTGTISMFASAVVGALIGTYIAQAVLKTSKFIDEKSGTLGNIVNKGKEFVEDLTNDKQPEKEKKEPEVKIPKTEEKTARERLKDKGLL
jgi:hypothetical protein